MNDSFLDAWLTVFARDGWAAARIDAVAEVAAATTADVAAALPDRWTALVAFGQRLDVAALAEAGVDRTASVRDRLFGMMMARFDAAQDHRPAVLELAGAARRDPALAAFLALHLPPAVRRLAEAAGVMTDGLGGPVRIATLTAAYLAVARAWQADDSSDLGATMKELDRRLAQAETWARRLPYRLTAATSPALPAATPRSAGDPQAG